MVDSRNWMKMSCTKPPLTIIAATPVTIAASVSAVRERLRKMLRKASLNMASVSQSLDIVAQRIDDLLAGCFPRGIEAGQQGRSECDEK